MEGKKVLAAAVNEAFRGTEAFVVGVCCVFYCCACPRFEAIVALAERAGKLYVLSELVAAAAVRVLYKQLIVSLLVRV